MRLTLVVAFTLFLIWSLWTSITQVNPGERAVVRRFGRILEDKPRPGLYVGLPWGIDRVTRVKVGQVRRVHIGFSNTAEQDPNETPPGQLLTGDHNLVNLQTAVDYSVVEDEVEKYVVQADRVDALVEQVAESAMARWVAGRGVDEVLLRGKAMLPRWLKEETQRLLDNHYDLGVRINEVSVTELLPPADVKGDFDEVARAQTEIRTLRNGAEQQADKEARDTAAEIYRIKSLVNAYTSEQVLLASAEAQAFEKHMKQYHELSSQNPYYIANLWQNDISRLYQRMRENGRLDLLDNRLSGNTLNITQMPLPPRK